MLNAVVRHVCALSLAGEWKPWPYMLRDLVGLEAVDEVPCFRERFSHLQRFEIALRVKRGVPVIQAELSTFAGLTIIDINIDSRGPTTFEFSAPVAPVIELNRTC